MIYLTLLQISFFTEFVVRSFELWLKNVHNKVRVVFNCWLIYFKKARKAILLDNVCSAGLTKLLKKRADFEFIADV